MSAVKKVGEAIGALKAHLDEMAKKCDKHVLLDAENVEGVKLWAIEDELWEDHAVASDLMDGLIMRIGVMRQNHLG